FINFDDDLYITSNPQVVEGLNASNFCWAWTTFHGMYWQPLTWLSLQFDAHFFSTQSAAGQTILAPAAFHAQNLVWHAASVLLLLDYWPLRRLWATRTSSNDATSLDSSALGQTPPSLGRLLLEKAPLFVLAGAVAVLTLLARERGGAAVPLSLLSLPARLANA